MIKGFLIDMDGVIYRGEQLIDGADLFIKQLVEREYPFMFLTNNSQRTRRDVATNLDPNCPVPNGSLRPGCGAIVAMLETATGRKLLVLASRVL
ncbi:MAG: hypothetical protein LLF92_03085 [Planctomycetaceae bacterium]|nr:hypothetical protein [Planctomycetaceae bacterium]